MSNKGDKQKQALLQQQQAEDRARQQALLDAAAQPSPLETTQNKELTGWLDATSGKNGPVDVTTLPGMGASWGLYDAASKRQAGDRMGIGALRLGAQGSNPNLSRLLEQQSADQRQQEAAGQFENAYRLKDAEMRGSVLPLLSLDNSRKMGLASLSSGNAANSTQAWANFTPRRSFWQDLLLQGVAGGSQVASAYAGKP